MLCLSGFELYSRWVPLINCRFTYMLMILTCYMLIEILIPLKELSMPNSVKSRNG